MPGEIKRITIDYEDETKDLRKKTRISKKNNEPNEQEI